MIIVKHKNTVCNKLAEYLLYNQVPINLWTSIKIGSANTYFNDTEIVQLLISNNGQKMIEFIYDICKILRNKKIALNYTRGTNLVTSSSNANMAMGGSVNIEMEELHIGEEDAAQTCQTKKTICLFL